MASGKRKYRQSRIPAEWQNRRDRGGQVKRSATSFALYSSHHQVGEQHRAANRRNRFQQSETGIGVRRVIPCRLADEKIVPSGPASFEVSFDAGPQIYSPHFSQSEGFETRSLATYRTTIFTSFPGTTITFTICLPAIAACTLASPSAACLMTSSEVPAATTTSPRSFPFNCTGISISSSAASAASYFGQGAFSKFPVSPVISHNSCAI